MAVSKQVASKATLRKFLDWCVANGYKVGEHPAYGKVHDVHMKDSWHYHEGAGDINYGSNGPAERAKLLEALKVAESLGLAVTFARDGTVGSAKGHQNHLHVDVGSWSNYGKGVVKVKAATTTSVPGGGGGSLTRRLQSAVGAVPDDVWGGATDYQFDALRSAAGYHGGIFPYGVETVQRIVGSKPDGDWGPDSRRKHDAKVKEIQRILGVKDDGIWGKKTEDAYLKARRDAGRG